MAKYIDVEKLRTEVEKFYKQNKCDFDNGCNEDQCYGYDLALDHIKRIIDSLQQEQPDKETILRICKLHKIWSIMAPWENVEDFVITNWNSKI